MLHITQKVAAMIVMAAVVAMCTFSIVVLQPHTVLAKPVKQACSHLRIGLRGKSSADVKCLGNNVSPQIVQGDCSGDPIMLFWDTDFSGGSICFYGGGSTDLTGYCAPWNGGGCFTSWNDRTSAYTKLPGFPVKLYEDIGDHGAALTAVGGSHSLGNTAWNDRISSVCIGTCP